MSPALADADAAFDRVRETRFVIRKFEMRFPLRRIVMLAVAQIFMSMLRPNHFARIHFPIRVPDLFELDECFHQFVAEHF